MNEWHLSTPANHARFIVHHQNAWPKDCQYAHTCQLLCMRGIKNRKHRASANKAAHGLLQSDVLQVNETNSARDKKDFTNYKISALPLLAYERDNNRVLGKKNAELEGRLAAAAGIIWELEKNQAALKSQLAITVSIDLFCP